MSFQIAIPANRRAAARFIGKVRRSLQAALSENPDLKRTQIADAIGVHRSVITRQLNGRQDMTLGRVAELAWAMGLEPDFSLKQRDIENGSNQALESAPASKFVVETKATNTAATTKIEQEFVVTA